MKITIHMSTSNFVINAAHRRVWEPDSSFTVGGIRRSVRRWTWTPTDGLKVEYLDGMVAKSSYRTLKNFLDAVQEGREGSVREVSEPSAAATAPPNRDF